MRVRRLSINNFRGVSEGVVDFAGHTLLVGGNNVGKSTVCEALDLVLGPERIFRRPVVDEHDFYRGRYLTDDGKPIEIRITAVLLDLSDEARRRFYNHLRPWDDVQSTFADEAGRDLSEVDQKAWALPITFIGRYDSAEDDFVGNTFFDHPSEPLNDEDEAVELKLGEGRKAFTRDQKRLCGFVFLRAHRTGSRALSLQRGSLMDTVLRLGGGGLAEMWQDTLKRLHDLDPAIGQIAQLQHVREEIRERMGRFVQLSENGDPTAFFASDLTREHLREVVRLFIATQPGDHLVPFERLGTGSLNLLVFALLTFIAELKEKQSVIFAMEEPEVALPPHTQRRVARFVLGEMGQAIVTSHSPYVIEQFEPSQIAILDRDHDGKLVGRPIQLPGLKPKKYRAERRQFAEAILSRAVLVVEGSTEAAVFPAASTVLEEALGSALYMHFDLAGVSVFDATGDGAVPQYGPVFAALGKLAFGFYDKPTAALSADALLKLGTFKQHWESPEKGLEALLAKETAVVVQRRFLEDVRNRSDYPTDLGTIDPTTTDDQVRELTKEVLQKRKGMAHGYAAALVGQCQGADELPATIRGILEAMNHVLQTPQAPLEAPEPVA